MARRLTTPLLLLFGLFFGYVFGSSTVDQSSASFKAQTSGIVSTKNTESDTVSGQSGSASGISTGSGALTSKNAGSSNTNQAQSGSASGISTGSGALTSKNAGSSNTNQAQSGSDSGISTGSGALTAKNAGSSETSSGQSHSMTFKNTVQNTGTSEGKVSTNDASISVKNVQASDKNTGISGSDDQTGTVQKMNSNNQNTATGGTTGSSTEAGTSIETTQGTTQEPCICDDPTQSPVESTVVNTGTAGPSTPGGTVEVYTGTAGTTATAGQTSGTTCVCITSEAPTSTEASTTSTTSTTSTSTSSSTSSTATSRATTTIMASTASTSVTTSMATSLAPTSTTPRPLSPRPPGAVDPPPVPSRVISLEFQILYQTSSQERLNVLNIHRDQLYSSLVKLYENTTGYSGLDLDTVPHDNCTGPTEYTVNYDSNELTADCQQTGGCTIQSQLDYIKTQISLLGNYNLCNMDVTNTQNQMTLVINQPLLDNPCLMYEHRCSSRGVTYTCKYDTAGLYCQNVCTDNYCGGGDCHAEHAPNNGHDGKAKCSCASFRFLSNDRCVSWWAVFGPLLAVAIIAIILAVALVLMKRVMAKKPDATYQFENGAYTNPVFTNSLEKSGPGTAPAFLAEEAMYMAPYFQKPTYKAKETDLHQYASLTPEELENHPDNKNFIPQLDKVDSTKEYKITRPKLIDPDNNGTNTGTNAV